MSTSKMPLPDPLVRRARQSLAERAQTVVDLHAVGAPLDAMVEAMEGGLELLRMAFSPTGAGLRSVPARIPARDNGDDGGA
jgi:hypothetical protein